MEPGHNPLDTHAVLAAAVFAAYGFSAKPDLLRSHSSLTTAFGRLSSFRVPNTGGEGIWLARADRRPLAGG
jgi:hypothetical protein